MTKTPAQPDNPTPATTAPEARSGSAAALRKLSVVIPVYNEEATVHELVRRVVHAPLPGGLVREIVCVNDRSTDATAGKLDALPGMYADREGVEFRIVHKPVNQGKGAALRDGFQLATGDILLVQDADLEYDPADYPKLLGPILDGTADVVFGSRFIGEPHRVFYFYHFLANRMLTFLSNCFTNLNLSDMEVCYKVFRREVIQRITLTSDRFGFEPEVTAKVARLRPRLRIYEVGVAYHGRSYEEGKKITWKDGLEAVWCIVKFGLFR